MADKEIDKRLEADIVLDFPITVDGQVIDKLVMRRPKLRDQFKMTRHKGDEFEKGLSMMADLTGQPTEVLLELDEFDAAKVQEQLEAFTGRTMQPGT